MRRKRLSTLFDGSGGNDFLDFGKLLNLNRGGQTMLAKLMPYHFIFS